MSSITIKEIPEELLDRLRRRAAEDRRSMNKEIIHLLAMALSLESPEVDAARLVGQIEAQVQAWRQLAGRWESDVEAAEEIERIYAARSLGRPVEL